MPRRTATVDLEPIPVTHRPGTRLLRLFTGLACYGTSMAMMVRAELGLAPWDVLHDGLVERTGLGFGTVTAITGALVLLCWIPLRQRPGIGTVANVFMVALSVSIALHLIPPVENLPIRVALLLGGVLCNGLATAVYVGARLGPGPRDGLMTGLHGTTGLSLRAVRTCVELSVLLTGWLLGGSVGFGTALYALAIGPTAQLAMPVVAVRTPNAG
ncbi:putative membrane protein YczE [Actinopolyspora lacussalsi]|nr:putative membrane protein YczE [Actinopolyspora lacussalsi]